MSFKVGDIVRVKDYKDINCFTFVPGMKCYCGHKYIITEIKLYPDGNVYKLNCGADFTFEEGCLEKVVANSDSGNKNDTFTFNAKKENKEMRKQEVGLTQRERIENKMKEYIHKSGVCSVNIIVPNRVVEVTFNDYFYTKVKTVCDKNDIFSLERALYIAYAKQRYNGTYTSEGIEKKADEFKYEKFYVSKVKNALKVYECQQKLAALDKEEEEIKLRQKQKRHERNERRRARRAEERKNEQIAIQKEAYLQAMMEFEEEKKKLESKKEEEEKQTESTKEIVKKVEKLISDAENTTEDTKENKEPEKANVVGENNKEESSENNVKEETTNKMKETESKVE
jgi:hypothetical protein